MLKAAEMNEFILYAHRSSSCSQMARLALVEKELSFKRCQVEIMETNEQFETWYGALNP
ncbi:MAG: glutathione S-transferase N-terminal domain-containing protein [Boseongicola sp.]|nr:glutathione S-transferase N-terminal domain-containing protein [Boseongicola sp.]